MTITPFSESFPRNLIQQLLFPSHWPEFSLKRDLGNRVFLGRRIASPGIIRILLEGLRGALML